MRESVMRWSLHSVVLLLAATSTAAHAELIGNGSFETYAKSPDTWNPAPMIDFNLAVGTTDIAEWTVIRGNIDYVRQFSGVTWVAADGERSLDLGGTPGSGGVSQTFSTVVGAPYEVRFYMSGNPNTGWPGEELPNKTLRVQVADQSADFSFDVSAEGSTLEDMKWKLLTVPFVADSNSTTMEIFSTMSAEVYIGPVIDNVSVTQIPEPSSLALLGGFSAAAALTWVTLRRRRE